MDYIAYKGGYKYQLQEDYELVTSITPEWSVVAEFLQLDTDGTLCIESGYAWDGPSGPTIDTRSFMRGSLVHDALYQLMRMGLLDSGTCRLPADQELQRICLEDGMCKARAWWVYRGVRWFASKAARPSQERPLMKAP